MPPRPTLPSDDLYARLELPSNATPEAIEIAWRALLRQHHPDVAGPEGLERAKRINVAHDWLSDPALRDRYDRERGVATRRGQARRWTGSDARGSGARRARSHQPPPRVVDTVERFLEHVSNLTRDELDRLALADPAPIAFGATIRRFLPEDRRIALEGVEAEIERRLPPAAARRPGVRDTVEAFAAELVLGPFLDALLSEPFRERTRERLSRGWEAAIGQPRYGPNGQAVASLIAGLRTLDGSGVAALARLGSRERLGAAPWPPGTSPDDDEVLRVSSALAAQDAAVAIPDWRIDPASANRARRAVERIAHLLVLRHAFAPAAFETLTAPWRPWVALEDPRAPSVRRPSPR